MTEGLKSETLLFEIYFLRKSLRLALTRPTSLYKGGCFPQKDGRRVRVSPNKFIYTKRKSTKKKSLCFFWRRRRYSTGFQPVVFALRTVYFMSLFAPQKDGRRVRVSCPFCNIQKKGTGENPDTFSGAEGETRRVFNPSCSLCEQFILCPFLLRKKMDEEFESPALFAIYRKKVPGKIPIPFLAQKERLELSRRLPDLRP